MLKRRKKSASGKGNKRHRRSKRKKKKLTSWRIKLTNFTSFKPKISTWKPSCTTSNVLLITSKTWRALSNTIRLTPLRWNVPVFAIKLIVSRKTATSASSTSLSKKLFDRKMTAKWPFYLSSLIRMKFFNSASFANSRFFSRYFVSRSPFSWLLNWLFSI